MTTALFVSPVEVDNPVDGLRWRAHLTARGLARVADLHVVEVTTHSGRHGCDVVHTPRTPLRRGFSRVHPWLPSRVAARDWRPAAAALRARPDVDLVWVLQADLVAAGVPLPAGALVVDVDALEASRYQADTPVHRWQRRRWASAHQRVCAAADAVVVSHPGEASSIDHPHVGVLPNAVDVREIEPADGPPTLTLVGRYTYQPNAEAAWWMASEVFPIVRHARPEVTLRLVGRHDGLLDDLRGVPGIEVAGFVGDLGPVWATTTAMVAPIRSGAGTRIKIIESFARGVPVVSTPTGCDGLDVVPGEHLLVADDPRAFARQCLQVLDDAALRTRLRRAALDLAARQHSPAVFEAAVAEVAQRVQSRSR